MQTEQMKSFHLDGVHAGKTYDGTYTPPSISINSVGSLTNTNFLPSQESHQTGTIAKSTCPTFQILATHHDAAIQ